MANRSAPAHPLIELTLTRFREFFREPEAIFWVFAFPVLITCALGIAFRSGSDQPVIVGVATSAGSDETIAALERAGGFTVRRIDPADVERAVRDGRAPVVIVPGTPPTYKYDAARAESQAARLAADAALQRAAGRRDAFAPLQQPVEAVGSRYIDWLVPGLLGMNVMGTGLWSISFSIVVSRMRKLLKRLVATPMSKWHYLASHVLNRLAFLALESTILITFAWLVFGVEVHGSLIALAFLAVLGAFCFGAIALLAASRVRTIEAVSGLLNVVMVPMWIFSGVFFASSNFPDVMQPFIQALPLTALNDAFRAIINEGLPLTSQWHEVGILVGWGGTAFTLALRLFKWQ
jgi:ABC-type multidrug transport system permease subunit